MGSIEAEVLRQQHDARMQELNVEEDELLKKPDPYRVQPPAKWDIRVLQWNILADGLANDGFLVRNVLRGAEERHDELVGAIREAAQVKDKKAKEEMFNAVREKFYTDTMSKNLDALIDWKRRWLKMRELIARYQPDIIAMQELDRMIEASADLFTMGYQCRLADADRPADRAYEPTHFERRDASRYFKGLHEKGFAFAPKSPSNARKIAKRRHLQDPDDDGVAIFWREAAFEALRIDFVGLDDSKRNSGSVRVELKRKADGKQLYVICAHLASGTKPEDERKRLAEIKGYTLTPIGAKTGPSLLDWFKQSAEEHPTIFCLDANSEPTRKDDETVWRAMHSVYANDSWQAQSVWDKYFTLSTGEPTDCKVATSNKMRGLLSDQQEKIGDHVLGVVDHIYYSHQLEFKSHVFEPFTYPDEAAAALEMLPNIEMPSDHLPVIADLTMQRRMTLADCPRTTLADWPRLRECLRHASESINVLPRTRSVSGWERLLEDGPGAGSFVERGGVARSPRVAEWADAQQPIIVNAADKTKVTSVAATNGLLVVAEWQEDTGALLRTSPIPMEHDAKDVKQDAKGRVLKFKPDAKVLSLVFHPSENLLVIGLSSGRVASWSLDKSEIVWEETFLGQVNSLAFGLAVSETSERQSQQPGRSTGEWLLAIAVEGKPKSKIHLRRGAETPCDPIEHDREVYAMAFKGGLLASGGKSKEVVLHERVLLKGGFNRRYTKEQLQHDASVLTLAFAPAQPLLASGGKDEKVKLWSTKSGDLLYVLRHHDYVRALAFAPSGKLLASGSDDSKIKLWSPPLQQMHPAFTIARARFSSTEDSLTAEDTAWKMMRALEIATHDDKVTSLAFDPDSRFIFSGGDDGKVLANEVAYEHRVTAPLAGSRVRTLGFAPATDGKQVHPPPLAVATHIEDSDTEPDKTRVTWHDAETAEELPVLDARGDNVAQGERLHSLDGPLEVKGEVYALAFSPNAMYLALGGDRLEGKHCCGVWTLRWADGGRVPAGELYRWLEAPAGGDSDKDGDIAVHSLAFSPDSNLLAVGGSADIIYVYSMGDKAARPHVIVCEEVRAMEFQPVHYPKECFFLLAVSDAACVRFFDVPKESSEGLELMALVPDSDFRIRHKSKVLTVAFSGDGQLIASGGTDKILLITRVTLVKHSRRSSAGQDALRRSSRRRAQVDVEAQGHTGEAGDRSLVLELVHEIEHKSAIITAAFSRPAATGATQPSASTGDPKSTVNTQATGQRLLLASAGFCKSVVLHDVETGELVRSIPFPSGPSGAPAVVVRKVAFSSGCDAHDRVQPSRIAVGGDCNEVQIHQLDLSEELMKLWIRSPPPPLAPLANLLDIGPKWLLWLASPSGRTLVSHAVTSSHQRWIHRVLSDEADIKPPGASALFRDQDGLHALDHALLNHETEILRYLLPHVLKSVSPRARVALLEAPPGVPSFLPRLAEQYPDLVGSMLTSIGLDKYEYYSGAPAYKRVPQSVLTFEEGTMALRGYKSDKPPEGFWERIHDKPLWTGPQTDVQCRLVGIPHLLDGHLEYVNDENNYKHRNLFKALVETENTRILTSDIMVTVIAFKWETYGRSIWYLQVVLFTLFFFCYELGVLFAVPDSVAPDRSLGLTLFCVAFVISLFYLWEEVLECRQVGLYKHFTTSLQNWTDAAQVVVQMSLLIGLIFQLEYARWLGAIGSLLMLPKAGAVTRGSKELSFTVFVIKAILCDMAYFMLVLLFVLFVSAIAFVNLLGSGADAPASMFSPPSLPGARGLSEPAFQGRHYSHGEDEYASVPIASFTMFRLMLGDFDSNTYVGEDESTGFATAVFVVTMFFVNIVLLNMLIALMSDTWNRKQEEHEFLGLKGRGQLLVEFDARMSKRVLDKKSEWFPEWLHVIKTGEVEATDGDIEALAMVPKSGDQNLPPLDRLFRKVENLEQQLQNGRFRNLARVGTSPA